MQKHFLACALALSLAGVATPVLAQSKGDWTLGVGVHAVDPKSSNGRLVDGTLPVDVKSDVMPTLTLEYFLRDNLGLEVIAATYQHDIAIQGLGTVGSTRHLPPTVSLQYHFNEGGKASPFLGVGLNYTTFFSEDTRGALDGATLKLDDSWGLAAHVGIDFPVGKHAAIRVDARWIDIDTDVKLDGVDVGTVNIDPIVYGAAYVMKF